MLYSYMFLMLIYCYWDNRMFPQSQWNNPDAHGQNWLTLISTDVGLFTYTGMNANHTYHFGLIFSVHVYFLDDTLKVLHFMLNGYFYEAGLEHAIYQYSTHHWKWMTSVSLHVIDFYPYSWRENHCTLDIRQDMLDPKETEVFVSIKVHVLRHFGGS